MAKYYSPEVPVTWGQRFVKHLLRLNHRVVVLDNFMFWAKGSLAHLCNDRNLEIINGDVRSKDIIKKLLKHLTLLSR